MCQMVDGGRCAEEERVRGKKHQLTVSGALENRVRLLPVVE
jgi:hypothetical protein